MMEEKKMMHRRPDERIIAVLKKYGELPLRELTDKAKVANSRIYLYLKRLEASGIVMHHYRVGENSRGRKFVKYYVLTSRR